MKIESTRHILSEKERNIFEVKTIGKRKDLDELRKILEIKGFVFDNDGNIENYKDRVNALLDFVNNLTGKTKAEEFSIIEKTIDDADKYISLFSSINLSELEFNYILDMNNIEIVTEMVDGVVIGKAVIDLKVNEDTGNLLFYKEYSNNKKCYNDLIFEDAVKVADSGIILGGKLKKISEKIKKFEVIKGLNSLGLDVRNEFGDFREIDDLLKDISRLYDEEMMMVSRLIAGEYNANLLFSLVKSCKDN